MSKNINDGYLVHYGIKGMKWGIRKYQNLDGSLTPTDEEDVSDDE